MGSMARCLPRMAALTRFWRTRVPALGQTALGQAASSQFGLNRSDLFTSVWPDLFCVLCCCMCCVVLLCVLCCIAVCCVVLLCVLCCVAVCVVLCCVAVCVVLCCCTCCVVLLCVLCWKRPTFLAILIRPIWANPFLANPFLANPFLVNPFLDLVCVMVGAPEGGPKPRKIGPRRVGPRRVEKRRVEFEGWAQRVEGPKFRAFFSVSRHNFLSFFLFWGPFVEFWWCLKRQGPGLQEHQNSTRRHKTNNHTNTKNHTNTNTNTPNNNTEQHATTQQQHEIGLAKIGWPNGLAKNGLAKIGLPKVGLNRGGRDRLWPIPFWQIHFWHFWISCVPKGGARRVGGPKDRAFFSLSRHHFALFCVFSWNFGGV